MSVVAASDSVWSFDGAALLRVWSAAGCKVSAWRGSMRFGGGI